MIKSIVALGGAAINVAFVFGAPIDEAHILALDGLLAGRDIGRARRRPSPVD